MATIRLTTGQAVINYLAIVFFRHDKRLHGEISRLIYVLVRDFATEAAGRPLRTAGILRKLLDERLAKNMLDLTHSGFRVDASIRVPATSTRTREALAHHVVRAPVSLRNLLLDEVGTGAVVYRAPYSGFFKTDTRVFPAVRFLAEVLQHLPDSRCRLIRTYGLYSSRARGTDQEGLRG